MKKAIPLFVLFFVCVGNALEVEILGGALWSLPKGGLGRGRFYFGIFPYGLCTFEYMEGLGLVVHKCAYAKGTPSKLAINGNYAFVVCSTKELEIFDISNPREPLFVCTYVADDKLSGVDLFEDYIFIARKSRGFSVLRFYPPNLVTLVSNVIVSGGVFDLAYKNGILALFRGLEGITLYDVSDPEYPIRMGSYRGSSVIYEGKVSDDGNYLYAAGDFLGFLVFDISDRTNPHLIGNYREPDISVYNVDIQDSFAYLGCGGVGLFSVDISNPASPSLCGRYYVSSTLVNDFSLSAEYGFLTLLNELVLLDISNPRSMRTISRYALAGGHKRSAVSGSRLLVSSGYFGLFYLDISNIAFPRLLDIMRLSVPFEDAIQVGNYIYAACGSAGLHIINSSVEDSLVLVQVISVSGTLTELKKYENWVFGAVDGYGVVRLNVSNPANPVAAGIFPSPHPKSICINGNLLYIADSDSGLIIVDINTFRPLGRYSFSLSPNSIVANGQNTFIADNNRKIFVFNTNNPTAITIIDTIQTYLPPLSLALTDSYLLAAEGDTGIQAFKLEGLDSSFLLLNTQGRTNNLTIAGQRLIITENEGIILGRIASTFVNENSRSIDLFFETYPNPTNSVLNLRLGIPVSLKSAEIFICDITGRKLTTLYKGVLNAGTYSFHFAMDNEPSGIYFVTLRSREFVKSSKIVFVK